MFEITTNSWKHGGLYGYTHPPWIFTDLHFPLGVCLCFSCNSLNKHELILETVLTGNFCNRRIVCSLGGRNWIFQCYLDEHQASKCWGKLVDACLLFEDCLPEVGIYPKASSPNHLDTGFHSLPPVLKQIQKWFPSSKLLPLASHLGLLVRSHHT